MSNELISDNIPELMVVPEHEGIYHFRDMKYIIRIIRKIAHDMDNRESDIDWLQTYIEQFLVNNGRIYKDLIEDLINQIRKNYNIPEDIKQQILNRHSSNLSFKYNELSKYYRHRAAHGSNYLRVGIPEFQNDILPKPINYHTMFSTNMAHVKDIIQMWKGDMLQSADDLEKMITDLVLELNKCV